MNFRAAIHPQTLCRWYRRAAHLKTSGSARDQAVYKWDYEPKLCWFGRLVVWLMVWELRLKKRH